jgi:hypothetical protein
MAAIAEHASRAEDALALLSAAVARIEASINSQRKEAAALRAQLTDFFECAEHETAARRLVLHHARGGRRRSRRARRAAPGQGRRSRRAPGERSGSQRACAALSQHRRRAPPPSYAAPADEAKCPATFVIRSTSNFVITLGDEGVRGRPAATSCTMRLWVAVSKETALGQSLNAPKK